MVLSIVLYSDILEKYFDTRNKFNKSSDEFDIQSIIEHPHNKIVFTQQYLKELEKIFVQESPFYNDFSCFFTELIDNGSKCDSISIPVNNGLDSEFVNIAKNCTNTTIALSYANKTFPILNYIYFTNCIKDQKISLLINLLKDRKYIVRYSDFTDNKEINNFFDTLLSIPKKITNLTIFERYANVNHSLYDSLDKKGVLFKYYMAKASPVDAHALKRKFSNIEIYSTNNKDLLHERTIIFENFIVTMDDDPFLLDSARETWSITIEYSSVHSSTLMKKCSRFVKTIY
jgi:hypothetical protein